MCLCVCICVWRNFRYATSREKGRSQSARFSLFSSIEAEMRCKIVFSTYFKPKNAVISGSTTQLLIEKNKIIENKAKINSFSFGFASEIEDAGTQYNKFLPNLRTECTPGAF